MKTIYFNMQIFGCDESLTNIQDPKAGCIYMIKLNKTQLWKLVSTFTNLCGSRMHFKKQKIYSYLTEEMLLDFEKWPLMLSKVLF